MPNAPRPTRCSRFWAGLAALGVTLGMPAPGSAFEMFGFRSGMNVEAFKAAAERMNYSVEEVEMGVEGRKAFSLRRRDGGEGPAVTFCRNELDSVSVRVEGGFEGLALAVLETRRYLGDGRIADAHSKKSPVGSFSRLTFEWEGPVKDEVFRISATDYKGLGVTKGWSREHPDCR